MLHDLKSAENYFISKQKGHFGIPLYHDKESFLFLKPKLTQNQSPYYDSPIIHFRQTMLCSPSVGWSGDFIERFQI